MEANNLKELYKQFIREETDNHFIHYYKKLKISMKSDIIQELSTIYNKPKETILQRMNDLELLEDYWR